MTSIRLLWLLLGSLWITAEVVLARRSKLAPAELLDSETQSEYRLWSVIAACLLSALFIKTLHLAPLPVAYLPRQTIALALFTAGLLLRFCAVSILGRLFTTGVAIQADHILVVRGPYRWVRHPAYSGLLLAFLAAGVAMGDAIAIMILVAPTFYVLRSRIAVEERMLKSRFGRTYEHYCKTTKKLLPKIY